jgi:hypothetical protein
LKEFALERGVASVTQPFADVREAVSTEGS